MNKLQFTPQMFECCIRDDVHIVAQKHYEAWYAECEKQVTDLKQETIVRQHKASNLRDKIAKYEKALQISVESQCDGCGLITINCDAAEALADTKEVE